VLLPKKKIPRRYFTDDNTGAAMCESNAVEVDLHLYTMPSILKHSMKQ